MFRERLSHPKALTHFHYVWTQSTIPWDTADRKQGCLLRSTDVEHGMGKKNLGSLLAKFSNFKMHLIRSGIFMFKGRFSVLCFLSARIKGLHYHIWS